MRHPFIFECSECARPMPKKLKTEYKQGVKHLSHYVPYGALCDHCVRIPGWFFEPSIRERIDPKHSGLERKHAA